MDDDCQQNAVPDGRARAERIRDIADEYLRSWADGEPVSVESILDAHEDLLPELEDELRKVRVIATAGGLDVRETLLGGGSSSEPARQDKLRHPATHRAVGFPARAA